MDNQNFITPPHTPDNNIPQTPENNINHDGVIQNTNSPEMTIENTQQQANQESGNNSSSVSTNPQQNTNQRQRSDLLINLLCRSSADISRITTRIIGNLIVDNSVGKSAGNFSLGIVEISSKKNLSGLKTKNEKLQEKIDFFSKLDKARFQERARINVNEDSGANSESEPRLEEKKHLLSAYQLALKLINDKSEPDRIEALEAYLDIYPKIVQIIDDKNSNNSLLDQAILLNDSEAIELISNLSEYQEDIQAALLRSIDRGMEIRSENNSTRETLDNIAKNNDLRSRINETKLSILKSEIEENKLKNIPPAPQRTQRIAQFRPNGSLLRRGVDLDQPSTSFAIPPALNNNSDHNLTNLDNYDISQFLPLLTNQRPNSPTLIYPTSSNQSNQELENLNVASSSRTIPSVTMHLLENNGETTTITNSVRRYQDFNSVVEREGYGINESNSQASSSRSNRFTRPSNSASQISVDHLLALQLSEELENLNEASSSRTIPSGTMHLQENNNEGNSRSLKRKRDDNDRGR